jgi:hypothetical protein
LGLTQAVEADGKAQETLARLVQFRRFYSLVMGWLYFTRIAMCDFAFTSHSFGEWGVSEGG